MSQANTRLYRLTVSLLVIVCLVIVITLCVLIIDRVYQSRYNGDACFNHQVIAYNKSLFNEFNPSIIRYRGEYLTFSRIDNRCKILVSLSNTTLPGVRPNQKRIMSNYYRNYVSIRVGQNEPILWKGPILPEFNKQISWFQQYEDPRIYAEPISNRLFMTATVCTEKQIQVVIVELNTNTFESIHAKVLSTKRYCEKNWNLFADRHNKTHLLTDACPDWVVREINLNTFEFKISHSQPVTLFDPFRKVFHVRCSTGTVKWSSNTLLTGLHLKLDQRIGAKYGSIFVEMMDQAPFTPLRVSRIFTFTKDRHRIEFLSGMCWDDNKRHLKIGIGIGDTYYQIVDLDRDVIFNCQNTIYDSGLNRYVTESK